MNCKWCTKEFKVRWKEQPYCSKECAGKGRSEEYKEKWLNGEVPDIERRAVKPYLIEMRGYKCEVCYNSEWMNNPIPLQVDHKNGDVTNNTPENLRLICPNCHSQTPHYAGGNRGNGRKAKGYKLY
jgi:hypothetical protein